MTDLRDQLAGFDAADQRGKGSPAVTQSTRVHGPTTALSTRQREVLALIAAGHTNLSIALTLGIKLGTVKNHVEAIIQKLCAENRSHAVRLALDAGELR